MHGLGPTIAALVAWLVAQMAAYGYAIVFVATILENLFVIGSLTPGETLTAAAGFTASQAAHAINPWVVWVLAITGTMIGTNLSYFLGRRGGRGLLARYEGRYGITAKRVAAAEEYFRDHGNKTIYLVRFVAVFKNFVPVLAGATGMDVAVFEGYSLAGALTYSSLMVGIGYFLGSNFKAGLSVVAALGWAGFALVILVIVGLFIARSRFNKAEEEKEAAEAGFVEQDPLAPDPPAPSSEDDRDEHAGS